MKRLLALYDNGSFYGYATSVLSVAELLASPDLDVDALEPPTVPKGWELPLTTVRIALHRLCVSVSALVVWKFSRFLGFRSPEPRSARMRPMNLKIVLEPSDEGGFTAYVPALPGCISEGDTVDEAMANVREAISLYLEPLDDDLAGVEGSEVYELVV